MKKKSAETIDPLVTIPGTPPPVSEKEAKKATNALDEARAAFAHLKAQQQEQARLNAGGEPKELLEERAAEKESEVEAKAPEAKPADTRKAKELERLRAKLLIASTPKKVVDALSDDEVREMWSGIEERERASATALQRASELEKQLSETTSKKGEPKRVPTPELDLEELHSELQEALGEDESGAVLKALQKLVQIETSTLREENASFRKLLEEARTLGKASVAKTNLDRLAEKAPFLKENQRARAMLEEQVLKAYEKTPSKYASPEEAYDDVYEELYGDVVSVGSPSDSLAKEKSRIGASALTPPDGRRTAKKPTPMEAAFAAFKHLKTNPEDLDGARAAYGRSLRPQ